jgi:hypothetical protein
MIFKKRLTIKRFTLFALTAVILGSCEQEPKEEDVEIPTASIGSAFMINDTIYRADTGEVNATLNVQEVVAKVNENTIAKGAISNGTLTISIPEGPAGSLRLYADQDTPATIAVNPNSVKTGALVLSFVLSGTTYELSKGIYNSIYTLILDEMSYVYADKAAVITGAYQKSEGQLTLNTALSAHFLPGWNVIDTKINISANNNGMQGDGTITTTIPSGYKWYVIQSD